MLLQRRLFTFPRCPSCRLHSRGLFWRSKEQRLERRKELWKKVDEGYFADLKEFKKTRGKRYEASGSLSSPGESVRFPRMSERALSGEQVELPGALMGQTTLVLVALRELGMRECDLYREPFEKQFSSLSSAQILQMLLVDKLYFRLLGRWIRWNLKKQIPLHRHSSFLCHTDRSTKEVMKALGVGNTIVGHAYLVDKKGLIRWRAHATPTAQETRALLKCSKQLLDSSRTVLRPK